jgi:hypothetical protein
MDGHELGSIKTHSAAIVLASNIKKGDEPAGMSSEKIIILKNESCQKKAHSGNG